MLRVAEAETVDGLIIGGDLVPHYLPDEYKVGVVASQAEYLRKILVPAISDFLKKHRIAVYLDLANDDFACNRAILKQYDGCHRHTTTRISITRTTLRTNILPRQAISKLTRKGCSSRATKA